MVDDWKERSTSRLAHLYAAWGNYQEDIRLNPYPSEQALIDQVHLGSPLGMALCEIVRHGYPVRRDIMAGPPQRADELVAVIRWRLGKERRELEEATSTVEKGGAPRRL